MAKHKFSCAGILLCLGLLVLGITGLESWQDEKVHVYLAETSDQLSDDGRGSNPLAIEGTIESREDDPISASIVSGLQAGCRYDESKVNPAYFKPIDLSSLEPVDSIVYAVQTDLGPVYMVWANCPNDPAMTRVAIAGTDGVEAYGFPEGTRVTANGYVRGRTPGTQDPVFFDVEEYATNERAEAWRSSRVLFSQFGDVFLVLMTMAAFGKLLSLLNIRIPGLHGARPDLSSRPGTGPIRWQRPWGLTGLSIYLLLSLMGLVTGALVLMGGLFPEPMTEYNPLSAWMALFLSLLALATLVWFPVRTLTGAQRGSSWTQLAQELGLQHEKTWWTLGRLVGTVRGRSIRIQRQNGLGDGRYLPSDAELEVVLPLYMAVHQLSDRDAWRAAYEGTGLHVQIEEWFTRGVDVTMEAGRLRLVWASLEPTVMRILVDQAQGVCASLETYELRGWRKAADAWKSHLEVQASSWTLEGGTEWRGRLTYTVEVHRRWTQLEHGLDPEIPDCWVIELCTGQGEGQRTGDPILDGQVWLNGFSDSELQRLIQPADSTEILMAAVCGQGLQLRSQQIEMTRNDCVVEPQALLQDATAMVVLLQTIGRPG